MPQELELDWLDTAEILALIPSAYGRVKEFAAWAPGFSERAVLPPWDGAVLLPWCGQYLFAPDIVLTFDAPRGVFVVSGGESLDRLRQTMRRWAVGALDPTEELDAHVLAGVEIREAYERYLDAGGDEETE